jgi:hypothetical protein
LTGKGWRNYASQPIKARKVNGLYGGISIVTARKRLDTANRIKASSVRKTERPPGAAKRKMIGQNSMRADEYNSFEKQLARYRAAISRIEEFNFKVASGSRLRVYERRMERLASDPRPAVEADLVFSSSFNLREIDEIIEIVTYLPGQPDRCRIAKSHQ